MARKLLSTRQIAKICHAANIEVQKFCGDKTVSPTWEEADDEQKLSAESGVGFLVKHLQLGNTNNPELMHNHWMERKIAAGWKYGPVKDFEAKTHPQLVPFKELPEEQQLKDWIFSGIVSGAFYMAHNAKELYIGEEPKEEAPAEE